MVTKYAVVVNAKPVNLIHTVGSSVLVPVAASFKKRAQGQDTQAMNIPEGPK